MDGRLMAALRDLAAVLSCLSNDGFMVYLISNEKHPMRLHRALLSQLTSSLLDGEDLEIADVCHHTVAPSTRDQFRGSLVQQRGDLTGKVCLAA